MRKQNSEFVTAFTSAADEALKNTDSFAHVELDHMACYVIADGIDDMVDAASARLVVDSVIAAFTETPSMSKRALRRYMRIANDKLTSAKSKRRLKASVTIVVHNYVKMRYAQAGNTRLRLYRSGFLKERSADHSLSMDMVEENKLEQDKLARHQERNNLFCYAGMGSGFLPTISGKIKLTNADALALYTRGIWEHIDEGELTDAFTDATCEPQDTVNTIEDLLFSKQPTPLEKYTLVVLFINKTFEDPNRSRRRKRVLAIVIPVLTVALVLTIVFAVRWNQRMNNRITMNTSFLSAVEFIQADNFIRARAECQTAMDLAAKLKDKKMRQETGNYFRLIESVVAGDDLLNNFQYEDAITQYRHALDQVRYADNVATVYISDKLERTSNYMSVYEYLYLGDNLLLNQQHEKAEEKYLEAKALASRIYFDKGRDAAIAALEKVYGEMRLVQEAKNDANQKSAEQQSGAAGILAAGDKAFAEGDYSGALVFYLTALKKYEELGDSVQVQAVFQKADSTRDKLNNQTGLRSIAAGYYAQAEAGHAAEDYIQAKKYYLLAKDIYAQIKDDNKVAEIGRRIELIDFDKSAAEAKALEEAERESKAAAAAAENATTAAVAPKIGPASVR